ncbi:MAG: SPOR domain-containing protein [Pseudoprimorskyibacter sp.]|nr:SPOR domain-containing protein [Pseudoprimorskyibacter sp.]
MTHLRTQHIRLLIFACFILAGCSLGGNAVIHSQRSVSSDGVSISDTGVWDGTQYLGGIWVTHPAASSPEWVVIRNASTGREAIGVLYPGDQEDFPPIRLSSDAAQTLGLGANRRAAIQIVADHGSQLHNAALTNQGAGLSTTPPIVDATNQPTPAPAISNPTSSLSQYAPSRSIRPEMAPLAGNSRLQIAVFSNRSNAERAVRALRDRGVPAQVRRVSRGTTVLYNVDTPPIRTDAARNRLLSLARVLGFRDAYATLP